jgi:hypothetical protein
VSSNLTLSASLPYPPQPLVARDCYCLVNASALIAGYFSLPTRQPLILYTRSAPRSSHINCVLYHGRHQPQKQLRLRATKVFTGWPESDTATTLQLG